MDSSNSKGCWSPLHDHFAHQGLLEALQRIGFREDTRWQKSTPFCSYSFHISVEEMFSLKRKPPKYRYVASETVTEFVNEEIQLNNIYKLKS